MQIKHQTDGQQGEFFVENAHQEKIAKLTYFFENDKTINANHTYVNESLRGQGIAEKLYLALAKFIQENQLTLHPTCCYIARKWERENSK